MILFSMPCQCWKCPHWTLATPSNVSVVSFLTTPSRWPLYRNILCQLKCCNSCSRNTLRILKVNCTSTKSCIPFTFTNCLNDNAFYGLWSQNDIIFCPFVVRRNWCWKNCIQEHCTKRLFHLSLTSVLNCFADCGLSLAPTSWVGWDAATSALLRTSTLQKPNGQS